MLETRTPEVDHNEQLSACVRFHRPDGRKVRGEGHLYGNIELGQAIGLVADEGNVVLRDAMRLKKDDTVLMDGYLWLVDQIGIELLPCHYDGRFGSFNMYIDVFLKVGPPQVE